MENLAMHWLIIAVSISQLRGYAYLQCTSPTLQNYLLKNSLLVMGAYFAAIGSGIKLAGTIGQNSERLGEKTIFEE